MFGLQIHFPDLPGPKNRIYKSDIARKMARARENDKISRDIPGLPRVGSAGLKVGPGACARLELRGHG